MIYFVWKGAATPLDSVETLSVSYGHEWILVSCHSSRQALRVAAVYADDRDGFGVSLPARYSGGAVVYDTTCALEALDDFKVGLKP